jgi:hypothetical protein
MLDIWNHYNGRRGEFRSFDLPAEVVSYGSITDYVPGNYLWRYAGPGSVEDLPCGGHNVSLTLETVPPTAASVVGADLFVRLRLAAGVAAGGEFVPGINETVILSIDTGAAFVALNGIDETITLSLEPGVATGDIDVAGVAFSLILILSSGAASDAGAAGISETIALSLSAGVANGGAAWSPAQLSAALWLDAADATTITQSGGFVTEWRDKSGNSRHATDIFSSQRPAYQATGFNGSPTLDFDGTDDGMGLSTAIALATTNSFDIFIAMAPNTTGRDATWGAGTLSRMPGSEAAGSFYVGYTSAGHLVCHHHLASGNNANGNIKSPSASFTSTAPLISHYRYDSAGGAAVIDRWAMRINGGSELTKTSSSTSTGWGTQNLLGRVGGSPSSHRGLISEVIITSSVINSSDREKVEGYLAHRWGLAADLPSGHPYKTSAP